MFHLSEQFQFMVVMVREFSNPISPNHLEMFTATFGRDPREILLIQGRYALSSR